MFATNGILYNSIYSGIPDFWTVSPPRYPGKTTSLFLLSLGFTTASRLDFRGAPEIRRTGEKGSRLSLFYLLESFSFLNISICVSLMPCCPCSRLYHSQPTGSAL